MRETSPLMVVDGRLVPAVEAVVPALDALTAEGVFETMLVRGGHVVDLDAHLQRLAHSTAALGIPFPATTRDSVHVLLAASSDYLSEDRALRLTLTRSLTAFLRPVSAARREGLELWRLSGSRALPEHKTLAWFPMQRLHARGQDPRWEGVWLDGEDVLEGNTSNLFAVIDGVVRTAPLGRILPGVTRARVLAVLAAQGRAISERAFTYAELRHASEAFATSSTLPVAPILSVEGEPMNDEGPVARALGGLI